MTDEARATHPYVGLWVTEDRHIRHELLPDNRYVEARGNRERAYLGRYQVTGSHIEYWDDTGFTADGAISATAFSTMPAWSCIGNADPDRLARAAPSSRPSV